MKRIFLHNESSHVAWINRCIVTLVAFFGFIPRVSFQIPPQGAYPERCITTLVTFFRCLLRMSFQMYTQARTDA